MNLFMSEVVVPPEHLPIIISDAQKALTRAVVEEVERCILWRAVVVQQRKIIVDGPLPPRIEIEPVSGSVSIAQWTPTDAAEVIPASTYNVVTREPAGTIIIPAEGQNWPAPERAIGSFALTYQAGWEVAPESAPGAGDGVNNVPASLQLLVQRALAFRAAPHGLGDLKIGSIDISVPKSYSTDKLPSSITSLGRFYQYRPGVFAARP